MSDEEIAKLVARVRMLARKVGGEAQFGQFIVGEDLETGDLSIDLAGAGMRTTILIADRDSNLQFSRKNKKLLKDLNYEMVLIELASI